MDVAAIKAALLKKTGISEGAIDTFNLYGELMCLEVYNYSRDNLAKTHQMFGAMIRPGDQPDHLTAAEEIATKLGDSGFACQIRDDGAGSDSDAGEDEKAGKKKIMLFMN